LRIVGFRDLLREATLREAGAVAGKGELPSAHTLLLIVEHHVERTRRAGLDPAHILALLALLDAVVAHHFLVARAALALLCGLIGVGVFGAVGAETGRHQDPTRARLQAQPSLATVTWLAYTSPFGLVQGRVYWAGSTYSPIGELIFATAHADPVYFVIDFFIDVLALARTAADDAVAGAKLTLDTVANLVDSARPADTALQEVVELGAPASFGRDVLLGAQWTPGTAHLVARRAVLLVAVLADTVVN
jgi:hypothetical protein